jgi:3-(methylthio)propanoyl-CoA dehydrogenase
MDVVSLFVYDSKHKAFTIRRIENKLGYQRFSHLRTCFQRCSRTTCWRAQNGFIKYVMSLMNSARLGVGAQSVGIAEAAYREALNMHTKENSLENPLLVILLYMRCFR